MPSKSNVISKKLSDYRKLNFNQIYIIIDILIILCDVLSKVILMICRYDAINKSYVFIEFLNMSAMVFGFLKTIFLKRCIKRLFFFQLLITHTCKTSTVLWPQSNILIHLCVILVKLWLSTEAKSITWFCFCKHFDLSILFTF